MTTYRQSACQEAPLRAGGTRAGQRPLPQATFDDLYSAVYRVLDDAKTSHDLVKLYKGSHASEVPHQAVLDFGSFFFQTRRGLLAYACSAVKPYRPAVLADLDPYDREHQPRLSVRAVFNLMAATGRRAGESREDFLRYLTSRTHALGAYRGGSSGYDDEARAVAAAHFSNLSVPATPDQTMIFSGGAKGAFLAFCAALMCRRRHDDLDREGGLLLAPEGYYQSLRLIPPIFGGDIHVIPGLNGEAVERWLARTSGSRTGSSTSRSSTTPTGKSSPGPPPARSPGPSSAIMPPVRTARYTCWLTTSTPAATSPMTPPRRPSRPCTAPRSAILPSAR